MLTPLVLKRIVAVVSIVVAAAGVVVAQSTLTSPLKADVSSPDELLAEVRGLRADFQQVARTSVRAQLLVARLQLQEQRINVIAGQLTELRRLIGVKESGQIMLAEQLKRFDDLSRSGNAAPEQQKDVEGASKQLKTQLAMMQKEDQELRTQETELTNQLTTEQGRWTEFNSRLDELERQLPISPR